MADGIRGGGWAGAGMNHMSSGGCDYSEYRSVIVGNTAFHIPRRYEVIKLIGRGAYGVVCSAKDLVLNRHVAIKKIQNAFRNLLDTKRILREIKLLRHLEHENIIGLIEILQPENYKEFSDIYIVSELMDSDLAQIINSKQGLSDAHFQYFVYQILRGLKYIHSANVLHRDLKPSNIFLNGDCLLKIADFGLARYQDSGMLHLTEYVATRWYRAPEVILSWKEYTRAIDVWAVGCIFAELLLRVPMFQGRDYMHQIKRITDVVGTPTEEDLANLTNPSSRDFLRSLGKKPNIPFSQIFPNANPKGIDLMQKMLRFNPDERISVDEALRHPYLESLHDPAEEPVAEKEFDFDFERYNLTIEELKKLVWEEMAFFHPSAPGPAASGAGCSMNTNMAASTEGMLTESVDGMDMS